MIDYYNHTRLHSAIDYLTPWQCLGGHRESLVNQRQAKHRQAAEKRAAYWAAKRDLKAVPCCDQLTMRGEAEVARAEERAAEQYLRQATDEAASRTDRKPGANDSRLPLPLREPAMPPNLTTAAISG